MSTTLSDLPARAPLANTPLGGLWYIQGRAAKPAQHHPRNCNASADCFGQSWNSLAYIDGP
ncbi:MAG: hypothetical protein EBX04_12125 [Rhodobacteraceae bacterium]|nr:hypothetical protein [Paracoccaceae bacterium]NCW60641.1 hypothetical protein [Paracoccaceae bacterium]NCX84562.1 hypothetical protein [Paracoccaceae bacterium]